MFTPEHYEAIGRLVVSCTELDALMTDLIAAIAHMDREAALMMVHHQNFANKVDTLKALIDARKLEFNDLPGNLLDTIDEAKIIYAYRSTLVHAAWVVGDHSVSPITVKISARGKLRESRVHQSTRKILDSAKYADATAARLEAFRARLF